MRKQNGFRIHAAVLVALSLVAAASYADPFKDALKSGLEAYGSENYVAAIASFKKASESPDKAIASAACRNAGFSFNALGDQVQAISWFERALGFDKNDLSALEGLALSCFGDRKTYEKGYQYARRAEGLFSERPEVYYNLACYFGTKGDAGSALRYVDAALFYGYADLDFLAADADLSAVQAKEPYKSFQRNFPSIRNALSLFAEAGQKMEKGDYPEASRLYRESMDSCRIALGTESLFESGLLTSLATAYYYLEQFGEALDARRRALAIQQKRHGRLHPVTANYAIYAGNAYYGLARYDDALSSYLDALAMQLKILGEGSADLRYTYNYLGEAYLAAGNYLGAAENFKLALRLIDGNSQEGVLEKASVEARLGSAFLYLGEFQEAGECFARALEIQVMAFGEDDPATISTYEYLGDLLMAQSKYAEALDRYAQDLDAILKSASADSVQAARCYQRLGSAHYSMGHYEESAARYEAARTIWAKAEGENSPNVAYCYSGLGAVYYTRGLYDDAIDVYSKSLAILSAAFGEDFTETAKNYLGLGLSYFSKGEFPKAISYYERAAVIQKKSLGEFNADLSRTYMNLSAAYSGMRDVDNAITYINKCIAIQERIFGQDHADVSVSYKMEGGIYFDMGNYPESVKQYEKALEIQERIFGGHHQQVAETKNNLGVTYFHQGKYDEAIKMYEQALGIKEEVFGKDNPFLGLDYMNLGEAHLKKGDTAKALEFLKKAQALTRQSPDRRLVLGIAKDLGELYYGLGRYGDAEDAFQGGIDLVENARKTIGSGKTEILALNLDLYYLSIKASAAQNNLDEVFTRAESMKARGYLDRLSLAGALGAEGISGEQKSRMLKLGDQIEELSNWRWDEIGKPAGAQDKNSLLEVTEKLKTLEAEFEKLDISLMSIPRYRDLRQPEMAKLRDAQKMLKRDQAFVDFILNTDITSSYASCLVIKRDSVALVDLDATIDYAKAVFEFREAIKNGSEDRDALGARLYDALIRPLEGHLSGTKRLIIVPDGVLAILPFDALRKGEKGPYLCQALQVSLTPSISVMKMTDGRSYGKRSGEWMGFGGVEYGVDAASGGADDRGIALSVSSSEKAKAYYAALGQEAYFKARGLQWKALPGTKSEVEGIASQAFGGKRVQLLLGEQASESAVKRLSESGELARQRIVHFACHAFFDNDYPQYSALVLSEAAGAKDGRSNETGYLTVEDVALLRFNADLAALSACETGQGGGFYGDGLIGFARSLLVAGVNRAELSLWPIDDEATRDFMVRWYTLIGKKGMDYSAALARTKREFIKSGKYSDPLFWSGFVLYGR